LEAQQTGLGLYQLRHGRISSFRIMTLTGTYLTRYQLTVMRLEPGMLQEAVGGRASRTQFSLAVMIPNSQISIRFEPFSDGKIR
jgi:hypothetical protein